VIFAAQPRAGAEAARSEEDDTGLARLGHGAVFLAMSLLFKNPIVLGGASVQIEPG